MSRNFGAVGKLMTWFVAMSLGSEWEVIFVVAGNLVLAQSHTLLTLYLHIMYTSLYVQINVTFYINFKSIEIGPHYTFKYFSF